MLPGSDVSRHTGPSIARSRGDTLTIVPAPPSCFVAIPLPPTPAVEALHGALPPEMRRVHPADIHLTTAYFGRIDPALHEPLLAATAVIPWEGADVVLGGALPLPSRESPTAMTLDLAPGPGHDAVVALMAKWRPRLAALAGVEGETRGPLPHLTFARPRGRRMTPDKRDAILAWADSMEPLNEPVRLGRLALFRSRPHDTVGPRYEVLTVSTD